MTVVLDLLVSILAGVSILFTFYFAWKAFTAYSKTSHETYSVGQQRARQAMQVNIVWSIMLLIISLILFGVSGLSFGPVEAEQPMFTATDTPLLENTVEVETTTAVAPTTPTTTPTLAPLVTVDLGTTPVPTAVSAPPTLTPLAPPSPTTTTAGPTTAVVSSGVGVWLRATPGTSGEQLEWLLDGTVLTVLVPRQQADGLEWQQVLTVDGIQGWVAVDYILYNEN